MKVFVTAVVLSMATITACSASESEVTNTDSAPLSAGVTLTCKSLSFTKGSAGSGQSVSALATRDLSGTTDSWSKYVEFSAGADATCKLSLPAGTSASSITGLTVSTNYRGPAKADMTWTYSAFDYVANAWVKVGDNGFAADWVWSAADLPVPSSPSRFVSSTGELQIRFAASSTFDVADVDQLVIVANTSSGGTGTDAGTTDSGTTDSGATDSGTTDSGTTGTIWSPKPGTSWQWQLTGTLDTSLPVAMYDIDLFNTSASEIAGLKARGVKVICYLSAGSYEDWRPDANQFPAAALGNNLDGWPGERWLDTRSTTVRTIMMNRMDLAVQKGCDGVEPDNVDGYTNNSGFPLTATTQLDYNRFLATQAHARKLSVALKNDLDQVTDLVSSFDFALNEQCFQYSECDKLTPFIAANKAVFEVEYGSSSLASSVCPKANAANFDTLIKNLDLDAPRTACR